MSSPPLSDVDFSHIQPDYAGWLTKRSTWLKQWRKRYFFLKGNTLYFAKDTKGPPHGVIDLSKCSTIKNADPSVHKPFSIELSTQDETYYLYANSEEEKSRWIAIIGQTIIRSTTSI